MSNFKKVIDFNKAFGVDNNTTSQTDLFDKDPKLTAYRLSLIEEEVDELKEAVTNKDFVEVLDALSDILYVVYGAFTAFGVDADKAFHLVHESNMSKLCKTESEAQQTVNWYIENDSERYDSPAYRKSEDGIHWVVYNKSTKKILKSINYKPVKFNSII